ncbi:Uncharacterised protein [Bordetella pertussis]|nr:Uncharacterised protein [Bordetella pertussis]
MRDSPRPSRRSRSMRSIWGFCVPDQTVRPSGR